MNSDTAKRTALSARGAGVGPRALNKAGQLYLMAWGPTPTPRTLRARYARSFAVSLGALTLSACGLGTATNVQQDATSLTGFVDSTGGVRLSYRLDFPVRRGKVPAVVIGHGSGEQTKASCRFLSTQFLARGYATFCYDKRGVGESTGEYS